MGTRIGHIGPTAQHRDGAAAGRERGRVSRGVNAESQAADDADAARHELAGQLSRELLAVARCPARTDDGHRRRGQVVWPQREQHGRRRGDLAEELGVVRVLRG